MTKLAKITVIVTIAAGIAFLGLLSGGQQKQARARQDVDLMQGHFPAPMPRYPGAKEFPMGKDLKVGASGMKMSYFHTRDDTLKIANFYGNLWKTAGYHVTEDITMKGGVVAAYDPAKGTLRQILIKRRDGKTMVFPSVMMEPIRPNTSGDTAGGDIPLYPGAEGVLRFGSRDPGHRSQILLFTNYGGLVNNVDFYRTRLPEVGWKEAVSKAKPLLPSQFHQTLTFHKGARELTLNITQIDTSQRVRVHITEATGDELGYPGRAPNSPTGTAGFRP